MPHSGVTLAAKASVEGGRVSEATAPAGQALTLSIRNAELWSPDRPFLYDLEVQLARNDEVIDQVQSYFGMRKIHMERDEDFTVRGYPWINGRSPEIVARIVAGVCRANGNELAASRGALSRGALHAAAVCAAARHAAADDGIRAPSTERVVRRAAENAAAAPGNRVGPSCFLHNPADASLV